MRAWPINGPLCCSDYWHGHVVLTVKRRQPQDNSTEHFRHTCEKMSRTTPVMSVWLPVCLFPSGSSATGHSCDQLFMTSTCFVLLTHRSRRLIFDSGDGERSLEGGNVPSYQTCHVYLNQLFCFNH